MNYLGRSRFDRLSDWIIDIPLWKGVTGIVLLVVGLSILMVWLQTMARNDCEKRGGYYVKTGYSTIYVNGAPQQHPIYKCLYEK